MTLRVVSEGLPPPAEQRVEALGRSAMGVAACDAAASSSYLIVGG